MQEATGSQLRMWGTSIVGLARVRERRELDWFVTGFSRRNGDLTLYIPPGFAAYADRIRSLGKVRTGKWCFYIERLEDLDMKVVTAIIDDSVRRMRSAKVSPDLLDGS
jgi:hypothetical protein